MAWLGTEEHSITALPRRRDEVLLAEHRAAKGEGSKRAREMLVLVRFGD